ncbi:MAG: isoprenylcysteine carboxylmethyltransferase family protein [Rickettsiales bacterium]|jgi:protein-S-isoprenylcysteine O-methyltransferase Ste14
MNSPEPNPTLLKARQLHSRIFAVVLVVVLLVSSPLFAENSFPRECMLWVGYAMVIFGAFGRVYCSAFIGGRKNDEVVRAGPFSVVRNPLYVFSFIAMIGIGLQSGMLFVTVILIIAFMLYYPLVVAKEEAYLENKFGEQYAKYKLEVPRWIPNMRLWNEPEQVDAKPKFIRKTILDASIFFLPMLCFALIAYLHTNNIFPVWFYIP